MFVIMNFPYNAMLVKGKRKEKENSGKRAIKKKQKERKTDRQKETNKQTKNRECLKGDQK